MSPGYSQFFDVTSLFLHVTLTNWEWPGDEAKREQVAMNFSHNSCDLLLYGILYTPLQIERCVALLRANQGASRRFYQLAVGHLSVGDVVKFILSIHAAIVQCVKSEGGEGEGVSQGKHEGGGERDEQEEEDMESSESDKSNRHSNHIIKSSNTMSCIIFNTCCDS